MKSQKEAFSLIFPVPREHNLEIRSSYVVKYILRKEVKLMNIKDNLKKVKENIDRACRSCGRENSEVKLIAVSKTKPIEAVMEAAECGILDFGENYVQEIVEKYDHMPEGCRIHMIGHLQTNKVKKLIGKVSMIHSVDSLHLAEVISRECQKADTSMDILLEVNIAEETSKFGFSPECGELLSAARDILKLPGIHIRGLMASAPITEDGEQNRIYFRRLRELLCELRELMTNEGISDEELPQELSMGMTGDYIAAIEEGATMVRIGTAIFGARNYG